MHYSHVIVSCAVRSQILHLSTVLYCHHHGFTRLCLLKWNITVNITTYHNHGGMAMLLVQSLCVCYLFALIIVMPHRSQNGPEYQRFSSIEGRECSGQQSSGEIW